MNGVRSPAASKMQGDKKRQGIGVQGRDECLPFARHGETIRGKGNAVFCPCFSLINLWLILPTWWCLLCIRYGHIKLNRQFVRTCALRRKAEMLFFQNSSQFQAACMKMFLLKLKYYIHLQAFKFSVQAALGFLICRLQYYKTLPQVKRFRPLRRTTRWLCPLDTRKPFGKKA